MNHISLILLAAFLSTLVTAQSDIFSRYYAQAKNIAEGMTLDQLAGQMIAADFEVVTDLDKNLTDPNQAVTLGLGSLLVSGMVAITDNGNLAKINSATYQSHMDSFKQGTLTNWKRLIDRFRDIGVLVSSKDGGKYKIKLLTATDAIHGDQHTIGTILFPHNIGTSCSHNEANFQNVGYWTRISMKKTGFNHAYVPTVAVSHNPQWGRYYETMGQNENDISKYAEAYVRGLQDVSSNKINGVLGSTKHFFGDGSTSSGCNMGNVDVMNFKNYLDHNLGGYHGSVSSNIGNVMVSYSAINWIPSSINSEYLMGLLRQDIKFNGFVVSDYNDLQLVNNLLLPRTFMNFTTQEYAYAAMVNGGTDMFMVQPKNVVNNLFDHAKKMTDKNFVPRKRLVESVTRILAVKMSMGLVQKLQSSNEKGEEVYKPTVEIKQNFQHPQSSSGNEYQDSLTAVRESLVLLKNTNNVLPARSIKSAIKYVVLVGQNIQNIDRGTNAILFRNFDNIGMQNGGWTVRWQGVLGNQFWSESIKASINASSILDALKMAQKQSKFELVFADYSSFNNTLTIDQERNKFLDSLRAKRIDMNSRNTIIIGAFGQIPYAESVGDINCPYCQGNNRDGCLYDPGTNPYAPDQESASLKVQISQYDRTVISTVKQADSRIPVVSVLLSGRPLIIEDLLSISDATIAAWLPGTSGGQGIVDAIVGNYLIKPKSSPRKNTLSMDWPKDQAELTKFPTYGTDGAIPRIQNRSFSVGDGLSTDLSAEDKDE